MVKFLGAKVATKPLQVLGLGAATLAVIVSITAFGLGLHLCTKLNVKLVTPDGVTALIGIQILL